MNDKIVGIITPSGRFIKQTNRGRHRPDGYYAGQIIETAISDDELYGIVTPIVGGIPSHFRSDSSTLWRSTPFNKPRGFTRQAFDLLLDDDCIVAQLNEDKEAIIFYGMVDAIRANRQVCEEVMETEPDLLMLIRVRRQREPD